MISVSHLRELHEDIYGQADRLEPIIDQALLKGPQWRHVDISLPWPISTGVAEIIAVRYRAVGWEVSLEASDNTVTSLVFNAEH